MRILLSFLLVQSCFLSIWSQETSKLSQVPKIKIQTIFEDSISIRAIAIKDKTIFYAGTSGKYGYLNFETQNGFQITKKKQFKIKDSILNFRAIAATDTHFFLLSIESPTLLYKIHRNSEEVTLVYREDDEKAFYDAMKFWNNREGIAMGDPTDSCLSIIITRDGGDNWTKIPCNDLPETVEGEAAFAASNGNISIIEEQVWIVSGGAKSRVFHSFDKGISWQGFETPMIQGMPTSGAYSVDFYDKERGIIFGGDYTNPDQNKKNKAISDDGGKTWKLVAVGEEPGYKSCVQYVPHMNAEELVAVGFTGISFSTDAGNSWRKLSNEEFYTLRFINDRMAVAAGKNRIAFIEFKRNKI